MSVEYFGIAEFYLSIFKVILIIGLLCFTFVTMLGGNPIHDRYGFRYWNDPGPFVEHLVPGSTGRFLGFLSCVVQATFSICGPEYISMVAGETKAPRKVLPKAFRSFVWRILIFFCTSALAMGIVIPSNDQTLLAVLVGDISGSGTGAASPYVIAMQRLQISGLPSVVNVGIMTSVLSAGNGILFAATRTLYGMSLEGTAPKFFSKTLKSGVPIYSVLGGLSVGLLAFLQSSNSSAKVLTWLVYLITACQLLNYFSTALTYRHFYAALKQQGIDRDTLPYKGKFQPYTSYVAMFATALMLFLLGYDLFITGGWDILYFFLDYTFLGVFPLAVLFWKIVKKTKYIRPGTADLTVGGLVPAIDKYERSSEEETAPSKGLESVLDRLFNGKGTKKA